LATIIPTESTSEHGAMTGAAAANWMQIMLVGTP
jgi:hypothetical protein